MSHRSRREFLPTWAGACWSPAWARPWRQDLGLARRPGRRGAPNADVRRPRAAGGPDAGDAGRPAPAGGRGEAEGRAPTCATLVAAAALANARSVRRPGLRRLPHRSWRSARPTRWRGAARGSGAAGPEGALPQHQPHPGDRRPRRTRCCTRSSRPAARGPPAAEALREATRKQDMDGAERTFAALARGLARRGLQRPPVPRPGRRRRPPRRAGLAGLGAARPHRQGARPHPAPPVGPVLRRRGGATPQAQAAEPDDPRALLPKLLDQHKLLEPRRRATARPDDAWVERLARRSTPAAASRPPRRSPRPWPTGSRPRPSARRSRWRPTSSCSTTPAARKADSAGKPKGSVHGALGRRPRLRRGQRLAEHRPGQQPRNAVASLIVGAYHTAGQAAGSTRKPVSARRAPARRSRRRTAEALLAEAEAAIKAKRPGARLRPGPPLRRARPAGPAGLRPAARATPSARTGRCTPRSTTAP